MREVILGYAGVDSGCVVIGDPCYLIQDGTNAPTWDDVCSASFDEAGRQRRDDNGAPVVPINGTFVVGTPHGDGQYPVYGLLNSNDEVVELRIELSGGDPDACPNCDWSVDDCTCDDEEWGECPRCGSSDYDKLNSECNEPGCDEDADELEDE